MSHDVPLKNVVLALTPLSVHGEGMFLAGRTTARIDDQISRGKLWLEDLAHVIVQLEDGHLSMAVLPVLGLTDGWIDLTNYTAFGFMEAPFTEKYEAWLEARNSVEFVAEEDVHNGHSVPDDIDGYTTGEEE